ncbi:glycosyltransferase family 32 protein [Lipingzhangella halophila]|nr:glycosyltransferase [Lipingzhangella halophila]
MFATVRIPKIVHVIWVGPDPFPYPENLDSFEWHNPSWEVRLWTDDNLPELHNQDVYDAMRHLHPAVRADLLRLELLHTFGGLYTDADSQCWKPLRPLVSGKALFGMTGNNGNVANGTLGATRGHPAIRALVEGAAYRYRTMRAGQGENGHSVFSLFGTRYITPLLRSYSDFEQIDEGCERGTRRLIAKTGTDATVKSTFIAHQNAVSWRKETGTDRVVL